MGYEYENSLEREYLLQIWRAIHNLETELNSKKAPIRCFDGINEIQTWTDSLAQKIKFAYNRNQIKNAPIRSQDTKTSADL